MSIQKCGPVIIIFLIFSFMPAAYAAGQSDTNTVSIGHNGSLLWHISNEVGRLNKIIVKQRQNVIDCLQTRDNITSLKNHVRLLDVLVNETYALQGLVNIYKTKTEITINTDIINRHSMVLDMILNEIEALNELIVAGAGENTVQCETDKVFNLILTGSNVKTSEDIFFILKYDPQEVEVLDLCNITPGIELDVGIIDATGLEITEFDQTKGLIKFKVNKEIMSGTSWSGVINGVKFKCLTEGTSSIVVFRK